MALLDDGFSTRITFGTSTFTLFEEIEVTPFSFKGGGKKNSTTMANTRVRTSLPKKLYDVDDMSLTVRFDPAIVNQVKAALQVNQLITIDYPDGSSLAVWGWLEEFSEGTEAEGELPTADIVIVASNLNGSGVETAPAFTAAA